MIKSKNARFVRAIIERPAGRPFINVWVSKKIIYNMYFSKKNPFFLNGKNDTKMWHFKGVLGFKKGKFLYDISVAIRNSIS